MAQLSPTLYNTIAQKYAAIDTALSTVRGYAKEAVMAIVNIDISDYPSPSEVYEDAALEVELALLQVFNAAYISSQSLESSTGSLLTAVRAINDFVILNTSGTATSTVKLQTWINDTMQATDWDPTDSCPQGWANMCQDAGYDISGWDTE